MSAARPRRPARWAPAVGFAAGLGVVLSGGLRAQGLEPVNAAGAAGSQQWALESFDLLDLMSVEVSTASKTAQSVAEAPASMSVITSEEFSRWGYQSVGEALEHVLGFYFVDDHILPNAGVRGVSGGLAAESGSIKVMIDGASVAYRSTSGNWLGVELVPLSSVRQIEVLRGPASALYGADAFLGVVNVITWPPDEAPLLSARGHWGWVGNNGGGQFDVAATTRLGSFDLLLGAAAEDKDRSGLRLPPQSPRPRLPASADASAPAKNLGRRSLVLQGRAGYRRPEGHLVVQAFASAIERGGDFAHWAQLTGGAGAGDATLIRLGQYRVTAQGGWQVTPTLRLSARGTYFRGGVLEGDRIEVASELFWVRRRAGYRGLESTAEVRWAPHADFDLIVGAETVLDREALPAPERISKETHIPLSEALPQQSVVLTNMGYFVSSTWRPNPLVKLTSGVRLDAHSLYGGQLTGRLGVTSTWSDSFVTKLLYGSAFKAPSPYLLYAIPLRTGDLTGERALKPQRIDTTELQALLTWGDILDLSTGVAYSVIRDKAEFAPRGLNQAARNLASQESLSWESRVDWRLPTLVSGYASFERTRSVRRLGQGGYGRQILGNGNVGVPPWIARCGVVLDIPAHPEWPLRVSAQGIVTAPTPATDASVVERGTRFDLPRRVWLNANVSAPNVFLAPGHETSLAVRGKNLLNNAGSSPGFSGFEYPLAPREVMVELTHSY